VQENNYENSKLKNISLRVLVFLVMDFIKRIRLISLIFKLMQNNNNHNKIKKTNLVYPYL